MVVVEVTMCFFNFYLIARYLRERILEIQDAEIQRSLIQINEIERVDEYNERLEARQEVLEDHNQRLADQLTKLRLLIQQVESTINHKFSKGKQILRNLEKHPANPTAFDGSEV